MALNLHNTNTYYDRSVGKYVSSLHERPENRTINIDSLFFLFNRSKAGDYNGISILDNWKPLLCINKQMKLDIPSRTEGGVCCVDVVVFFFVD